MFKMCCGIPNTYILDITMYKMHVSLCSYCTVRILISKTLTGTYEGGYTFVFELCCYRTLDIVMYIFLLITKCVYKCWNIKIYAVIMRLVSDILHILILHSWQTFRLSFPMLSVEYNINLGKLSLTKRNITAEFLLFQHLYTHSVISNNIYIYITISKVL